MKNRTRQTLKIFWQHSRAYGWQPYVLFFGMIVVTLLRDANPLVYRSLINFIAAHTPGQSISPALRLIVFLFILNIARVLVWRTINFLNAYFQASVMRDLVRTCYEYLQKHSIGYFNSNFVGSLVTKVKRYERSFEQLSDQFMFNLGRSFVEIMIIIVILLWVYLPLGLIVLGWAITYIIYTYLYAQYKLVYDIKRAEADTETTAQLADTITNNFNIKIFAKYQKEFRRFADVAQKQFLARKKSWYLGTLGEVFQGIYMISAEFFIMYWAVIWWDRGILTLGDIVLIQAYLIRIFDQLWDTGKNIRTVYEALADANEMTEILQIPHEVKDAPNARTLKVQKGEVRIENVIFSYTGADREDDQVLKNFNLTIHAGERIALVGQSGGGKSTIVKLLLRFFDLQAGKIFIDGQDISKCTQDSLRANIGFVPQDPILFHRTLMENIKYARPEASDAEVIAASKLAHCHEFISSFTDKYETFVGERGIKLSGGERQRIAIARAVLKNAPILMLDEATSSLDSESEMYIQDALKALMKGKTTIVVAHRLSTIMQMDRILVIEGGHIVEEGKHAELVKAKKGIYQRLWEIQAGGFA
jgi:ATP-binding cassette subfamily B protein